MNKFVKGLSVVGLCVATAGVVKGQDKAIDCTAVIVRNPTDAINCWKNYNQYKLGDEQYKDLSNAVKTFATEVEKSNNVMQALTNLGKFLETTKSAKGTMMNIEYSGYYKNVVELLGGYVTKQGTNNVVEVKKSNGVPAPSQEKKGFFAKVKGLFGKNSK